MGRFPKAAGLQSSSSFVRNSAFEANEFLSRIEEVAMVRARRILGIASTMLVAATCVVAQVNPRSDSFVLDPNRPFVYLKFDHFGPGATWGDDEVPFRIWFRLVNNCKIPIKIRTFGGPDGALGVMDRVVEDEKIFTITSDTGLASEPIPISILIPELPSQAPPQTSPAQQAASSANRAPHMPFGYESEVSSVQEIASGKEVYFSLPASHLSKSWHFVIPFTFKVPQVHCCRAEDVGGEPEMHLTYKLWDLPPAIQTEIKKM
jgi:hypothetical protein